jgi:regulator of cell morphogenesis and NO signaling
MDSLFVPSLQPALKHPTILKKFDELKSGETFLLVNDHDPIPLY